MLKEKIQEDLRKALKEKKEVELSVLRMLRAALHNKTIEKRTRLWKEKPELKVEELKKQSELMTDEEVIEVILTEIKKKKEAILEFEKGERTDLVNKEKTELEILQKYLPEQLSEEEIKKLAKKIIKEVEAKDIKDLGKVMSQLMPKLKGRAEGRLVSKIVKELLTLQITN